MSDLQFSSSRTLHRLLYVSRQTAGVAAALPMHTEAIVAASIRNNREVGVTGLLLTYRGWFIQALEGSAKAVMTTYGRIIDDPRHEDSHVIFSGPVESRAFAAWKMCARHLGPADAAVLSVLDARVDLEPTKLTPASCLRLLRTVADIQARTAVEVAA